MSKTTPKDLAKKRNDEKLLVSEMIALYCLILIKYLNTHF